MCGICGKFMFRGQAEVPEREIRVMASTISHRGPDDEGYYVSGPVGLGFRRLSIIDLVGGQQPMSDAEQTVWVVFNGEIYNFRELRTVLEQFGHRFRTKSDTEVIVHGYKQWGDGVLSRLNGMFGLAVWDIANRRLLVARDRAGIKPVYYRIEGDCLSFGSEIRAVMAGTDAASEVDVAAIYDFLRYRYTPAPRTIVKGVLKLSAGTCLVAECGRPPEVRRWWNWAPRHTTPSLSCNDAVQMLAERYEAAVSRHLVSDVPVGLLLSGGIDSALLLKLMLNHGKEWNTYTVGYGANSPHDELAYGAWNARGLGGRHHTDVQIDRSECEAMLGKVVGILEEPVATASIVPMYYICQRARQDVKVALIGQGPDELFGGYTRHLGVQYGTYWRMLPPAVRRAILRIMETVSRGEQFRRSAYSLGVKERLSRYQQVLSIVSAQSVHALFREAVVAESEVDVLPQLWAQLAPLMGGTDELGGLQFLEVRSALPDELLLYADKISMAHSLELRVPFLDQEVIEFAECLPASFKVRHLQRKWLHRKIAGQLLPREILKRKKLGFASEIVDDWFRNTAKSSLIDVLRDGDSLMYRYLRHAVINRCLDEHQSGHADNHKLLFSLVVLEYVLRRLRSGVGAIGHI